MAGKKDRAEAGERIRGARSFRLADIVNLSAILGGSLIASFTALGLNERIAELSRHQTEAEQRIDGRLDKLSDRIEMIGDRLSERMDRLNARLSDQIAALDERLSRMQGRKITAPPKSTQRP